MRSKEGWKEKRRSGSSSSSGFSDTVSALIRRGPLPLAGLLFAGCGVWSAAGPGCGIIEEARAFPAGLTEASGVAPSLINTGVYWTHSDDAGPGVLWAVDAQGAVLGEVELEGVTGSYQPGFCN